jgi:hypothetical protein
VLFDNAVYFLTIDGKKWAYPILTIDGKKWAYPVGHFTSSHISHWGTLYICDRASLIQII